MRFASMLPVGTGGMSWHEIQRQVEGECYVINRQSHLLMQLKNNCTHNSQIVLGFASCNYLTVTSTIIP